MSTAAIKHPVPDRQALSVRVPRCQKLQMMAKPGLTHDAL